MFVLGRVYTYLTDLPIKPPLPVGSSAPPHPGLETVTNKMTGISNMKPSFSTGKHLGGGVANWLGAEGPSWNQEIRLSHILPIGVGMWLWLKTMHFPGKDGPKKPIHLKLLPKNFRMLQLLESSLDITSDVKSGCFDGILRNAYPKKSAILDGFCFLGKNTTTDFPGCSTAASSNHWERNWATLLCRAVVGSVKRCYRIPLSILRFHHVFHPLVAIDNHFTYVLSIIKKTTSRYPSSKTNMVSSPFTVVCEGPEFEWPSQSTVEEVS